MLLVKPYMIKKIIISSGIFLLFIPFIVKAENTSQLSAIERADILYSEGNISEALRILSTYKPPSKDLSEYYKVYARALRKAGQLSKSIVFLRLAYIYSDDEEEKQTLMIERAETYQEMGYYNEAAIAFKVFHRVFDNPKYREKVNIGIADSLFKIGLYNEAMEYYKKAGESSRALYGLANTLTATGRIKEANSIYISLIQRDSWQARYSPETRYYIGENFRLMGRFNDAILYLNSIKDLPMKYNASISLGLIALEKNDIEQAIKYFKDASNSSNRQLKRRALFHLAEAYEKLGRYSESISVLLEIRNKYPYGKDYDASLLRLSRIYKNEGRFNEAALLLRELLFRRSPERDALDELESIILLTMEKDKVVFLKLWKSFGNLLLDPSRSESIIKIVNGLRESVVSFIDTCKWLIKYGTDEDKIMGKIELADYYADLGDSSSSLRYLQDIYLKKSDPSINDRILRIKAKNYLLVGEKQKSLDAILSIKEIDIKDASFLPNTISSRRDLLRAIDFLKRAHNKFTDSIQINIKLADLLFINGEKSEALKHYFKAAELLDKNEPDSDEINWVYYRISAISDNDRDIKNSIENIRKKKGIIAKYADVRLMELDIKKRKDYLGWN